MAGPNASAAAVPSPSAPPPRAEPPASASAPAVASSPPVDALGWLVGVQRGDIPLGQAYDQQKGVAFVEYQEDPSGENPRANSHGDVQSATLLCTDADVLKQVRAAFELGARLGPITCEAGPKASCTFRGMEGTAAMRVFVRAGPKGREISAITQVSEDNTMAPAWVAAARAWTQKRLAALEKERCR